MRTSAAAICLVAILLPTCGCRSPAHARLAKDLVVVAASPVQVPLGGLVDTYRVHRRNPWTLFGMPVVLVHHTLKHAVTTLLHAGDVLLYPFALADGSGPVELYDVGQFPFYVPNEKACQVMGRFYVFTGATAAGSALA